MMNIGAISYGIAALGFLVLTVLLVTSWRGRRQGALSDRRQRGHRQRGRRAGCRSGYIGRVPVLLVYLAEVVRSGAWLLALRSIAGRSRRVAGAAQRALVVRAWLLRSVLLDARALAKFGLQSDADCCCRAPGWCMALLGLVLLEQIYRNSSPGRARGR